MKLTEIAQIVGVSPATVSRALNHPKLVKKDTLEKILKVIEELDYTPHPAAQALMTGKTQLIGLIVPNLLNVFIAQLVLGIEDELLRHGYTALICNSHEKIEREHYILRNHLRHRVDGIIWAYPHDKSLRNVSQPLVLIGPKKFYPPGPYDNAEVDEESVISISINRFYNKGHRKIAVITGDIRYAITEVRLAQYKKELTAKDIHVSPDYIVSGSYDSIESGAQAMRKLLALKDRPTAVFAFNDMLAIGALKELADQKIDVPGEMAIIGSDDIPIAKHFSPRLTTVRAPGFDLGKEAARLMVTRLYNPTQPKRHSTIPVELVIRNSD